MYYYIGHLSKFIQPSAKRINQTNSDQSLLSTSFKNPDGKIATIIMNQSDREVVYSLINNTSKTIITIPAHAMQTVVY
ncbi:O-Glycosyl hydrolase family 30 [compost metagenome]